MTLHKTDHLSEKDIQKRKSTFSNFELQELLLFFNPHFKVKKDWWCQKNFFYNFDILQKVSKYLNHSGWIIKKTTYAYKVLRFLARKFKVSF